MKRKHGTRGKRMKKAAVLLALLVLVAAVSAYAESPSGLPQVNRIDFDSLDSAQIADVSTEADLVAALADPDVIAVSLRQDIQLTAPLQVDKDILFRSGTRDTRTIWSAPQENVRHMYISPYQDITVQFRQVILDGGDVSGGMERKGVSGQAVNVSTIIDPIIQNCLADDGGALFLYGDFMIVGGLIQDNQARNGGGLYLVGSSNYSGGIYTSVIIDTVITNNIADSNDNESKLFCRGGGISARLCGVKIINCTISDNYAAGAGQPEYDYNGDLYSDGVVSGGGGIYFHWSSIELRDSEVIRNMSAGYGGGIQVDMNTEVQMALISVYNSKILNNTAGKSGGGIGYAHNPAVATSTIWRFPGAALKIYDSEISDNRSEETGDGIYTQGAVDFYGTVICDRNYEESEDIFLNSYELGVVCKQLHTYPSE